MKARTHRTIFWAAIAAAILGIAIFTQTESWASFWLTAASTVVALFSAERGQIYDEEVKA